MTAPRASASRGRPTADSPRRRGSLSPGRQGRRDTRSVPTAARRATALAPSRSAPSDVDGCRSDHLDKVLDRRDAGSGQLRLVSGADDDHPLGIESGRACRSESGSKAVVSPSAKPSSMSAASPVVDVSGGQASSWPSTKSTAGAPSADAPRQPSRIGQSPPRTIGNRPPRWHHRRRRVPIRSCPSTRRARSRATPGRGPARSVQRHVAPILDVHVGRSERIDEPGLPNGVGARATPSVVPEELNGTPTIAIRRSRLNGWLATALSRGAGGPGAAARAGSARTRRRPGAHRAGEQLEDRLPFLVAHQHDDARPRPAGRRRREDDPVSSAASASVSEP